MWTRALATVLFVAGAALLGVGVGGASAQQGVWSIITRPMFQSMLSHRGDSGCQGAFYTYDAFIEAASKFPGFGTTGDEQTRRRELAAFFGQTSHETTGGWATAPGGPFAWGYCRVKEQNPTDPPYYGRGPIQLTHEYNYRLAGQALNLNLVGNPDLVASDPVVAFKTAIWFWMTPQSPKPSCHAVMTGAWTPSATDRAAGRLPGYGLTSNIINGGLECGKGQSTDGAKDRVGYYKRYCDMLRVGYGDNVPCKDQKPYGG
ncbi:Chitinase 11 precursor [Zea mays]|uniref:chitinase n=1 Tax=Zea mays TaxID=4577 RepID=C0P3M6_MAIZE|nr:Chitinase 11 precursor [Zea mays]ACN27592.1 unknown [Zea mays]ONL93373.1 Basic endochitinase B [Zea mays]